MKVLLMHKGDAGLGGGQVQILRLASRLNAQGVDAKILCRDRVDSIRMKRIQSLAGGSWRGAAIGFATGGCLAFGSAFFLLGTGLIRG